MSDSVVNIASSVDTGEHSVDTTVSSSSAAPSPEEMEQEKEQDDGNHSEADAREEQPDVPDLSKHDDSCAATEDEGLSDKPLSSSLNSSDASTMSMSSVTRSPHRLTTTGYSPTTSATSVSRALTFSVSTGLEEAPLPATPRLMEVEVCTRPVASLEAYIRKYRGQSSVFSLCKHCLCTDKHGAVPEVAAGGCGLPLAGYSTPTAIGFKVTSYS